MQNISFGSTYKVNVNSKGSELKNFNEFSEFCSEKEMKNPDTKTIFKDNLNALHTPDYKATQILIAPDYMDKEIETFCANKGIKFTKYTNAELLNGQKILERIADAPENMMKVRVNAQKMESYLDSQESNIAHCKKDYDTYYTQDANFMLKSGEKIPATPLYIHGFGESTKDILRYIDRYGADNLNENQLSFCFERKTDEPDHCTYFVLKELGMKDIPVYVDKDTYLIGNALGLFSED